MIPFRSGLLAGLALAASPSLAAAQNPPPGFTYQTLVDGPLYDACAMAFLPDGRLLLVERISGNIRVFRDGALDPQPWASVPVLSPASWSEQGLLGIAVDPGFLTNGYVYVYFTEGTLGQENLIARLQDVNGVGTNLTVLTPPGAIPAHPFHNGGAMVFGHDGLLYVATGDAMNPASAPDPTSWNGKVLRFEVPNLTVPAGNPFPGSPVFSLGHRNHFGLTIHPVTGFVYQTENGEWLMDEVNRIVAGGDYGWPAVEGQEIVPDPAYVDPALAWIPTTAPTGTCFYQGEHYPAAYRDGWFVTDFNQNRLRLLTLDPTGETVVADTLFDQPPGAGYAVLSGPDGNLWYLTNDLGGLGGDELGRYVHAAESVPSAQMSSVSNKTIGASVTICVHSSNFDLFLPWVSLARLPAPFPTPWGDLWVPLDMLMSVQFIFADDRAYQPVQVPNLPTLLGTTAHMQALVLTTAGQYVLTNPSSLTMRG